MTAKPSPQQHATRFRAPLLLVVVLGSLNCFGPLSVDMHLPALPLIVRDLDAPRSSGALTVAAFYVGLCVGQLFHGPISDRYGRRPPILAGVILSFFATVAGTLVESMPALIGLRFLQAIGACAGMVVSRAMVRDLFSPQDSAQMFSLLLLVMSLAPVIAPVLGSFMLLFAGWRMIFWVLALFSAVVGAAAYFALPESRTKDAQAAAREEHPFRSYWAVLRERPVMAYALTTGFAHGGFLTYLAISPEVIMTAYRTSPQAYGWIVAVNGIGLILSNYLNRRLLAIFEYDSILRYANLASILATLVLLALVISGTGGLWGIVIPLFFIVAAIGFIQPNAAAGAMAQDPARAGATSAMIGFLQFSIGACLATIASALHDGTAIPMAATIVAAYVLAGVSLRILPGRGQQSPA